MRNDKSIPKPEFEQYIVLVLGMHRSGTSTFVGIMNHLGCALPEDLMLPTEANPKGYFESVAVSQFNDRMLDTAGASWRDWHPINASWFASPVGKAFLPEARDLLKVEFGNTPLAVLKDPRVCRMVPFWLQAIAMADYRALPVLVHRNPLEVAASLKKRDGISLIEGHLIWLRYVLDAEKASRGQLRFITSYDRILADWSGEMTRLQKDLGVILPRLDRRAATAVEDFVSPELRHFTAAEENMARHGALPAWVYDTYQIFERWAAKGEVKADYKALDEIGAQVDAITPIFAELVDAGKTQIESLKASAAEHKSKYDEQESELARLGKALETTQADLSAERAQTAEREAELDRRRDKLSQTESALAQREEEVEQVWQRAKDAEAELEKKTAEIEELIAQDRDRLRELDLMTQTLNQADGALRTERSRAEKRIAELEADQAEAQVKLSHLAEREATIEELSGRQQTQMSELAQLARLLNESEKHLQKSRLENVDLRTQLGETKRLQSEPAAQQAHIKFVESELAAIRASRFWRATGPMRRLLDAMRGKA